MKSPCESLNTSKRILRTLTLCTLHIYLFMSSCQKFIGLTGTVGFRCDKYQDGGLLTLLRQQKETITTRGQSIKATVFCTKSFENPSGHGRPRRKSWMSAPRSVFSCSPGDREKLFDPSASRHKGQECPPEIQTQKIMLSFSSLNYASLP